MSPLYDAAIVTFQGGPFDGEVERTGPGANLPTGTPAETFAGFLCFVWGADKREGKSIVGRKFMAPNVPAVESVKRAEQGKWLAYKYLIESATVDDKTLRIVCTWVGTTADD